MSNLDFDSVLKKYNNNPQKILDKYNYPPSNKIKEKITTLSNNNIDELKNIINEIVLWKLNRMVDINDKTLIDLCELKNINEADKESIIELLKSLLGSTGVKLAIASTFLHFFNPSLFPIFDQRAYRVIFNADYKAHLDIDANAKLYFEYLKKCHKYYKDNNLNFGFSEIDKYLYQLDKEAGNKVKM